MSVRVRIAPSPTGSLHLGLARTALFNWLFARQKKGTFIFRIDDTDVARSTEESLRQILDSFRWLGLDWDEGVEVGGDYGPYIQSQRLDIYKEYAQKLLDMGKAYYCYCTQEELEAERAKARAEQRPYIYSGRCKNLSESERRKFISQGRVPSIRLSVEDKLIVVNDIVKGRVEFRTGLLGDFIIVRPSGMPMYNYASAIDDMLMKITHIIRADEHLSNTPKQILIYEAFNCPLPEFAHVPLVLGSKGEKLSKRHGATSIEEYRKMGYLPAALINYLARLGWSYDDEREIFSIDELIELFSLEKVGKSGSIFDPKKLLWINGEYIMKMDINSRTKAVLPFLREKGYIGDDISQEKYDWIVKIVEAVGDRLKTLSQIIDYAGFFFTEEVEFDQSAVEQYLLKENSLSILETLEEHLKDVEPFDQANIERAIKLSGEQLGINPGKQIQPLRVAVTGKSVGPGIFETLILLGKEKTLKRLCQAISMIRSRQGS